MRIAVRSYGHNNHINGFGGGEQRWTANISHFLANEGHEIIRTWPGSDNGCDLFLDAPWEVCRQIRSPKHVHFSFSPQNRGAMEFPCIHTGTCVIANPYPAHFHYAQEWIDTGEVNFIPVLLPIPYPDDLIPENLTPGFQRKEIAWATKDNFNRAFSPDNVFVVNGLDTLRALIRLKKKADFKLSVMMAHHLAMAHPKFGVGPLLSQLPIAESQGQTPWQRVLSTMARCKINVPVGGLLGSAFETVVTGGVPLMYPNNVITPEVPFLPDVRQATENDIYEALETLWFDERKYNEVCEYWQSCVKPHRTESFRKYWELALEKIFGGI